MLGKTHLFYGVTAGAAVALALAHPARPLPLVEGALAGAFGGLLPDLDEPGSTISNAPRILGKMARRRLRRATRRTVLALPGLLVGAIIGLLAAALNLLSRALSRLVRFVAGGHREGSHWLPVWAGLSVAAYLLTVSYAGPWPAAGFSAGYLSHLAGDGCTKSGIPHDPARRRAPAPLAAPAAHPHGLVRRNALQRGLRRRARRGHRRAVPAQVAGNRRLAVRTPLAQCC